MGLLHGLVPEGAAGLGAGIPAGHACPSPPSTLPCLAVRQQETLPGTCWWHKDAPGLSKWKDMDELD